MFDVKFHKYTEWYVYVLYKVYYESQIPILPVFKWDCFVVTNVHVCSGITHTSFDINAEVSMK